jgi:ribonuclease-3
LYDFRDDDEGILTRKRSEKVSGRALAKAARQLELDRFIRLGRGEEKTGGREKASILADTLEALVGAVYLDSNFQTCSELVIRWTSQSEMNVNNTDFKSKLQEILQRKEGVQPVYRVIREYGPEHEKVFEVEVYCQGDALGRGAGITKKAAEQAAARESLFGI